MNAHDAATTLSVAIATGALLVAIAERLQIPSIVLLLLGGVAVGPEFLGVVRPDSLGAGLELVVTLAVAVVLFEGGLTLDAAGFKSERVVISRMLTVGVLVTWAGAAVAAGLLFGFDPALAAVAGSLLIVTGPTVISPLLRRIDLVPRLHQVLYWEGVVVDAVGVFCAVLCFEWILASGNQEMAESLARFGLRFFVGAGIGVLAGCALALALRHGLFGARNANVAVLGGALLAYAIANELVSEAGILTVITAGLAMRVIGVPGLSSLKRFKLELTELAVGLLFVLLSARLDLSALVRMGWPLLAFVGVILVLRPLNVAVSTWGQPFSLRERGFLSWLAPRGIVAASMASLFSLRLAEHGYREALLLEPMVFAVIGTTVLVQGLSAPAVASWLGLKRKRGGTWMLIGDAELAVELHRKLRHAGAHSLVLASPRERIPTSDDEVAAVLSHSIDPKALTDARVENVEAVLALSGSPEVNDLICELWAPVVGASSCYRWDREPKGNSETAVSVWEAGPGPERVMAAIEEGRSRLEVVELGKGVTLPENTSRTQPLMKVVDGSISIAEPSRAGQPGGKVVVLRERIAGLSGLIHDALIVEEKAPTIQELHQLLLARAASDHGPLRDPQFLEQLREQEAAVSTAIGHGVAIPHLYVDGIAASRCYVASVPDGADLFGPDGKAVRLVFLVLSSSSNATCHLQSLAAIATLAEQPDMIQRATSQLTRRGLLSVLREYE